MAQCLVRGLNILVPRSPDCPGWTVEDMGRGMAAPLPTTERLVKKLTDWNFLERSLVLADCHLDLKCLGDGATVQRDLDVEAIAPSTVKTLASASGKTRYSR